MCVCVCVCVLERVCVPYSALRPAHDVGLSPCLLSKYCFLSSSSSFPSLLSEHTEWHKNIRTLLIPKRLEYHFAALCTPALVYFAILAKKRHFRRSEI